MSISEESLTPRFVGTAEKPSQPAFPLVEVVVFLAAVLGRMPALGAWWNLDDWGLLGRAAGLIQADNNFPARIMSQQWYWDFTWPLFGTHADPHTWLRLALHGTGAILVTRLARRAGLNPLGRLVAGLMVAATPLAFTPLYWAAGIQEILAAVFALAALDRFLAGNRKGLFWATGLAAVSILSKESGLFLPIVFLVMVQILPGVFQARRKLALGLSFALLLLAILESVLVFRHFGTGPQEPYALASVFQIGNNLGTMGWWMLSPGPLLAETLLWPQAAAGAMLFVLWTVWGISQYQTGKKLPILTLLAALGSIAPGLLLARQMHPYLGYLAIGAGALALASLLPRHWKPSSPLLVGLAVLAATWGFFSMETRLNQRNDSGLPADPVVQATSLSWEICRLLPQLPLELSKFEKKAVTFLQIPMTGQQMEAADQLGERWVAGTRTHESIGGSLGPRLILGNDTQVDWVNALFNSPPQAMVLCEMGPGFKHWGNTANATMYAALADVGMGRFERAHKHFLRAAALNEKTIAFAFDPTQMAVSVELVLARKEEFIDWTVGLLGPDHSVTEVGGVQDIFLQVLSAASGISLEELTAESAVLIKERKVEKTKPE